MVKWISMRLKKIKKHLQVERVPMDSSATSANIGYMTLTGSL
jgi:hypothetical protein